MFEGLWSVRLVVATDEPVTEDQTVRLDEILAPVSGACGTDERGRLDVNLAVDADTLPGAVGNAATAVVTGCLHVGATGVRVVETEAMEWTEFERRIYEPTAAEKGTV